MMSARAVELYLEALLEATNPVPVRRRAAAVRLNAPFQKASCVRLVATDAWLRALARAKAWPIE
jgi:hypothetical protein